MSTVSRKARYATMGKANPTNKQVTKLPPINDKFKKTVGLSEIRDPTSKQSQILFKKIKNKLEKCVDKHPYEKVYMIDLSPLLVDKRYYRYKNLNIGTVMRLVVKKICAYLKRNNYYTAQEDLDLLQYSMILFSPEPFISPQYKMLHGYDVITGARINYCFN